MKRFLSLLLSLLIVFTSTVCTASADSDVQPANFEDYEDFIAEQEYPAMTTEQFLSITNVFNTLFRFFTGDWFGEEDNFKFRTDAMLKEICDYMAEETSLDLLMILTDLPESKHFAEFVNTVIPIDTALIRDKFFEQRDKFYAEGKKNPARIMYFLGVYFSVIDDCEAYCLPCEEQGEGCYEIHLRLTLRDGTEEIVGTGVIIDTVKNLARAKDDTGILGTGYEFSYTECLLYTQVNVWMRNFGFCLFYDLFSYVTPFFFYETRRIKFDCADKEWMIQIWKGNYLISNGAEVGIYNRSPERFGSYYDCAGDEDMMPMSMKLYHGEELLFEREEMLHWWLTGFKIDDILYPSYTMTLEFTIELKDEAMLAAFCEAIDNHYMNDIAYSVEGLKVTVIW